MPPNALPGKSPSFLTWAACQLANNVIPDSDLCSSATPSHHEASPEIITSVIDAINSDTSMELCRSLQAELNTSTDVTNEMNTEATPEDYIDSLYAEVFPEKHSNTTHEATPEPVQDIKASVINKLRQLQLKYTGK